MTSKRNSALIKNKAQYWYNNHFKNLRRQAKEENLDLSLLLSRLIPNELMFFYMSEHHRTKNPPDTSKMKQRDRELCLKEWYRPFFYEWLINNELWDLTDRGFKSLKARTKGAREALKKTQPRSNAKHERIIKEVKQLIASKKISPDVKRGEIKIVVEALNDKTKDEDKYRYNYVQDCIKLWRRNENPKC